MTTAILTQLIEYVAFSAAQKITPGSGVVPGVRILSKHSKNDREYSATAMRQAAQFYEGVPVNIDHPERGASGRERGFIEGFGELRNVRVKDDGVYGDLHYALEHPMRKLFEEKGNRFPTKCALSHNAEGQVVRRGNKNVVEFIERVRSVDVVTRGAINTTLWEQAMDAPGLGLPSTDDDKPVLTALERGILKVLRGGGSDEEKLAACRDLLAAHANDPGTPRAAFESFREAVGFRPLSYTTTSAEFIAGLKYGVSPGPASYRESLAYAKTSDGYPNSHEEFLSALNDWRPRAVKASGELTESSAGGYRVTQTEFISAMTGRRPRAAKASSELTEFVRALKY